MKMLILEISNQNLMSLANRKLVSISIMAIAISGLVGCQPSEINLADVEKQTSGKTVYLTGRVSHIAPFVDNAAYQLQDDGARVWVVTSQTPPTLNTIINIKGKIQYQSLPFATKELGDFYVIELERLATPLN